MTEQEKHTERDVADLVLNDLTVKVLRSEPRFGARYLEAALDEEDDSCLKKTE